MSSAGRAVPSRCACSPGARAAPSAPRSASTSSSSPSCPWALGPTSISCRASRPACSGWRCCSRPAARPTASSTPTTRTARSTSSPWGRCRWSSSRALKSLAHWITTGVPLALLAPSSDSSSTSPIDAYPLLVLTMLAGTPAVSFVAAIGAALTLGLRRSGVLLALLVLPLYVPVLIFGVATVSARERRAGLALAALPDSLRALACEPRAGADRRGRGASHRSHAGLRRRIARAPANPTTRQTSHDASLANPTRFLSSCRAHPAVARRPDLSPARHRPLPRLLRGAARLSAGRDGARSCTCTCRAPGSRCSATR